MPHLLLPTFAYFCLLLLHQARAALAAESLDEATDLAKQAEEASAVARQKRREAEVLYIRLQKGRAVSEPRAVSEYLQSPAVAAALQSPVKPTAQPAAAAAQPAAAAARGAPLRRAGDRGGLKFGFQKASYLVIS